MKLFDAVQLYENVLSALALKGLKWEAIYALSRNKSRLKSVVEAHLEAHRAAQERIRDLALVHCKKDREGKPVIIDGRYAGLEYGVCPEYDKALNETNRAMRAIAQEEISEYEPYRIKKEYIKAISVIPECTGAIVSALLEIADGMEAESADA